MAVNILNRLAETNNSTTQNESIYVPIKSNEDSKLHMELIGNCVYCDKYWYQSGFDVDDLDSEIYLIHDKIQMKTAEQLNIASCLSKILNVEDFQCSWGQTEDLTTRINNLLRDYTDGLSVLKELVQNADDAGATEISFVYDERDNDDHKTILLDEHMKDLQGPAIWCHNNAMFSEDDFTNIAKLGGATKECMNTKIGRFGLGFNSIYNLTEVPMFLSNDSIVIFDPHKKYLQKALPSKDSPGIRLRLSGNHQKICRLKDQFAPFNGMFGCDFSPTSNFQKYQGTLFRFPLRTEAQARKSKICMKHYNKYEVVKLLQCLIDGGGDFLLFAQNLRRINLHHMDTNSDMTIVYSLSRKIRNVIKNNPGVVDFSYLRSVSTSMESRTNKEFILLIDLKGDFETNNKLNLELRNDQNSVWCVSWCTGVGESYELYLNKPAHLPIGAVATKLEDNGGTWNLSMNKDGKMFCFLPLPSNSPLPLHVNGYFALNSSRTHIYSKILKDKVDERWIWNEVLMSDCITSAYCNLLQCLATLSNIDLYHIFPNISNWRDNPLLVESIYRKFKDLNLKVCKSITDNQMHSFCECQILSDELQVTCFSESIENVIKSISNLMKVFVLKLPQNIYNCLLELDNKINITSKVIDLKTFYNEWFLPHMDKMGIKERDIILVETLIDSNLNKYIIDHSCIPVVPKGFKYIHQVVNPTSKISVLFDEEDGMFPLVSNHMKEKERSYMKVLDQFGMRSSSLTKGELIDRCESVEKCHVKMQLRLPVLLDLIENYLHEMDSKAFTSHEHSSFLERIKSIKMLPIKSKPIDYPLPWKPSSHPLTSFEEGYLIEKMLIAAPNNVLIDETQSFKEGYPRIKKQLKMQIKFLSMESLQILIKEINKHFNENDNYSIKDRKLENIFKQTIEALYKEINCMIQQKMLSDADILNLCEMRFILTNGHPYRLMSTNQCSEFIYKSLMPYMCGVNETNLSKWNSLWSALRIKSVFSTDDFVNLLKKLETTFHGIKLDDSTLNVVIETMECISNAIRINQETIPQDFYLPNKEGVLCLSSFLSYNDCDWSEDLSRCCHDKISKSLALQLGIKTARETYLFKNKLYFPFGQREELTNRINRIIGGYPINCTFKEMVQNADDAMASEIHFINDTRSLPVEKIFSDEWKALQGPALCIYNDKSFTLEDLKGIQKLGEGAKQNDITKTGQYGVGFNCVYHLTDAPSFFTTIKSDELHEGAISGSCLAVFDPNCHFLPEVDKSNPGALYKSEVITDMFTDVYSGFLQDVECYDIKQNGTMFRLPLRNKESASMSSIKGKVITTNDVDELLKELLMGDSHLLLLFLKSLESIKVVKVTYDPSRNVNIKVIQELRVQFKSVKAKETKEKFLNLTKELSKKLQNKLTFLKEIQSEEVLYEMKIMDCHAKQSDWIVIQRFGFKDISVITPELEQAYEDGTVCLQPCGGIAFQIKKPQSHGLYSSKQGQVFSFLPLSITTNLPVHIHGHFVLNNEDRKCLWTDNRVPIKTMWNEAVMSQTIAPAYCSLLCYLKEQQMLTTKSHDFDRILSNFYDLFPSQESHKPFNVLTKEIYNYICTNKLDLFLVYKPVNNDNKEWTHVNEEVYFEDLDSQFSKYNIFFDPKLQEINLEKARLLRDTLHSCGLKIIVGPITLWKKFQDADQKNIKNITPANVRSYLPSLSDKFPLKVEDSSFRSTEGFAAVVCYILQDMQDMQDESNLENLPIILTSNNIIQKATKSSKLFESKYHDVAPHKQDMFIHQSVEQSLQRETKIIKQLTISDLADLLKNFHECHLVSVIKQNHLDCELFFQNFTEREQGINWLNTIWKFIGDALKTRFLETPDSSKKDLSPIHNLNIVPVMINNTKTLLYPLNKRSCILKPLGMNDKSSIKLFKSLESAGAPILNTQIFKKFVWPTNVLNLFCDVHNPMNLLAILDEIYINLKSNITPDKDQGLEILKYLSDNLNSIKDYQNAINILMSLPFYIDMNGNQIALKGVTVFVFSDTVPCFDVECLPRSQVFLKYNNSIAKLFEYLGLNELTIEETYVNHLFHVFDKFSLISRMEHLEFIKRSALSLIEPSIIEGLKNLKFIEFDGHFRKASYFYCNEQEIFKLMNENFPPQPFDSFYWKQFLKSCGLVTELSNEKYLEYALKIPSLRDNTSRVQQLLVEHLLYKLGETVAANEDFLRKLKSIPFLSSYEVSKDLLNIHPKKNNDNFIPFEGAATFDNVNLCWTVSNVLPSMINKFYLGKMILKLNVMQNIDANLVLENLINISRGFDKLIRHQVTSNIQIQSLIKQLTEEHLSWLQSNLSHQQTIKLQDVKCLYVDELKSLVRPNQVVIDITYKDQIYPYICKLPMYYGKLEKFLIQNGATKQITQEQCTRSLEEIKNCIGEQKMDPAKEHIADRLFEKFLQITKKDDSKLTNLKKLFIPCLGYLRESSTIYCTDNYTFKNLIGNLQIHVIITTEVKLLMALPESIRPKLLDDYVKEKLVFLGEDAYISIVDQLRSTFSHPTFLDGLMRIKYHENKSNDQNISDELFAEDMDLLEKTLTEFKFFGKDIIRVHTLLEGNVVENSQKEVPYCTTHGQNNEVNVYVSKLYDTDNNQFEFFEKLATHLGFPFMLLKEILVARPDKINFILGYLGICPFYNKPKPRLGNEIQIEDHFTLVQDFSILYPSQYVAYEIDDPFDSGEDGEPHYILVEIIKLNSDQNVSRFAMQYEVNCGFDRKIVFATRLYAFETTIGNTNCIMIPICDLPFNESAIKTPASLSDIIEELKSVLKEVWKLLEDERKKAVKRLYLKYHPDKNLNNKELYDEAFKHLKILIQMLENGKSIDSYNVRNADNLDTSCNDQSWNFDFERMNRRARQHCYSKQKKGGGGYKNKCASKNQAYRNFFNNFQRNRRGDPKNAELWMKQAQHNKNASMNDFNIGLKSPQWRSIKCYEGIKCAIRAVCFSKNANDMPIVDKTLKDMCSVIFDEDLDNLAVKADAVLINMEYLTHPNISKPASEKITDVMADEASVLVDKIIFRCDELITKYNKY